MVVNPNLPHVLPLEPGFIRPQDGHDKQDCEIAAVKRWLNRRGSSYVAYQMTLLGDDLYVHQPFRHLVLKTNLNFIFVCKPHSHQKLYEWLDFLQTKPDELSPTVTRRHWNVNVRKFGPIIISTRWPYGLDQMSWTLTDVN